MSAAAARLIERAASEWLVRLRDESVTAEDHADFDAWLSADRRHGEAFERVSTRVSSLAALGPALKDALAARSANARTLSRRGFSMGGLAVAAAAGFAFLGFSLAAPPVYTTAVGEQRRIELRDGSTVELNTDSRLVVRFSNNAREIELTRGEAVFDVAHDASRPFIVEAAGQEVRAIGTQFAVRLDGSDVSVLVSEGVVAVSPAAATAPVAAEPTRLAAGHKLDVGADAAEVATLAPGEIERHLTWRSGMLQFDGQTLAEAVTEVSRYTGARFALSGEEVRELRVWAYFRASDLDGFLTNLEMNNPSLEIERSADVVRISKPTR